MKLNEDGKTVAAMDCLVPGIGEIIGGSQREDDYGKLTARMEELGLNQEDYGFYLDLRRFGSARHAVMLPTKSYLSEVRCIEPSGYFSVV